MKYLDSQFQDRVVSWKLVRGRDWPARSPDRNPCDFCLWGYLKSKVTLVFFFFSKYWHLWVISSPRKNFIFSVFQNIDILLLPGLHSKACHIGPVGGEHQEGGWQLGPGHDQEAMKDMMNRANLCVINGGGYFEA
jgi:hypothetical protein